MVSCLFKFPDKGFSRECGTGMYKVLLFKCVFVPIASLLFAPFRFRKSGWGVGETLSPDVDLLSIRLIYIT